MKKYTLLTSCIVLIFFITSCGQKFKSAEYVTATDIASAEEESQVSLDDGASISIPPNSIDGKATVKIERNPEKVKNLPVLPDGFVQLSDFYNFEITGANLIGPVDITIPYNTSKIPDEEGIPFALFPTSDGWKYVPVQLVDGKATIYTHEIGDPLIAWRFSDLSLGIPESEREKAKYICDPDIAVQAIDNGDGSFQILGLVQPPLAHKNYNDPLQFLRNPAAKLPVSIILNERDEPGKSFQLFTDDNGNFQLTLDTADGVREGWNWVFVKTKCDPWFLQVSVESRGYAEFKYTPTAQNLPVVATEASTEPPVAQPETIDPPRTPTEYVLVPNVIGVPFDAAKGFLERIGYKVIWIDGKSTLEVGQVFSQDPRAGKLTVPHRTTVVLFRTTETVEEPKEILPVTIHYSGRDRLIQGGCAKGSSTFATLTIFPDHRVSGEISGRNASGTIDHIEIVGDSKPPYTLGGLGVYTVSDDYQQLTGTDTWNYWDSIHGNFTCVWQVELTFSYYVEQ